MKRGRRPHPDILTPREWEVLELIRQGLSNEEIASRLGISIDGAKYHVSEILTKLGVPDRLAAARWRPDRGRVWLPVPIAPIRLGWSHVIGGAAFAVVVASTVGVFVWLLSATGAPDEPSAVAVEPTETPAGPAGSVMLFDVDAGTARRIPVDHGLNFAQWLAPGETFVAYDWFDNSWNVFDLQGRVLQTVTRSDPTGNGRLVHSVVPSADGHSVIVEGVDDLNFHVYDVATGTTRSFDLPSAYNSGATFSPDGMKIAFVNQNESGVRLYAMSADGTAQAAIRSLEGAGHNIAVASWSRDSRAVLAYVDDQREVISLDGDVLWSGTFSRLTDIEWTALNQLLVLQPEVGAEGGGSVPAKAWYVDVITGGTTPAPARSRCCYLASPDGSHAIAREMIPLDPQYQDDYNGIAPGGARCALIRTTDGSYIVSVVSTEQDVNTGFCASIDWSPDSRFALASMGGN